MNARTPKQWAWNVCPIKQEKRMPIDPWPGAVNIHLALGSGFRAQTEHQKNAERHHG